MPPRSTGTATPSIITAPVSRDVHVPIPMCASTAKANIKKETVIDLDKQHPPNKTQHKVIQKVTSLQPPSNPEKTSPITTPIKPNHLSDYLNGYSPVLKSFLIQGFTFGFKILYTEQRVFRISKNLSFLQGQELLVSQRLQQELKAKRIAGPYSDPPFVNLQVSPLGLVLKKASGEFRLIHHLSYSEGNSINDHIPNHLCTVQYQSIDTAISLIQQLGPGTLLAKTDIENAYKQIPVHPSDFELLGFRIGNDYYYDKTLSFGLSYSCNLFERFSTALQWILENKFSVAHCVHVLDDFLFIGPRNSSKCLCPSTN